MYLDSMNSSALAAKKLEAGRELGRWLLVVLASAGMSAVAAGGESAPKKSPESGSPASSWADWVERDFPFYSAMVYAERSEIPLLAENRTARGLVLNLGADLWACFDLELLRVAAVWEGEEAKMYSNAAFSYHGSWPPMTSRKARLPLATDAVWLANGVYPGWQVGTEPTLRFPKSSGARVGEIGRVPPADGHGRFRAVRLTPGGVRLEYDVADATVEEQIARVAPPSAKGMERRIRLSATPQPLVLILAVKPPQALPTAARGAMEVSLVPGKGT